MSEKLEEQVAALAAIIGQHTSSPARFTRADMDEIAMITGAISRSLPDRFVSVVQGFDKKFSGVTSTKEEFLNRLLRILEVNETLPPSTIPDETKDTSLVPRFSLSEKDKTRVLKLCSDMRKIILASADFDEPHKLLMLNRVAAVEKQALDPRGMLDVVRGAATDVGETLGKFGKDIKPLTDRFKEVVSITRKATPEYDQIPAPEELKRLPAPEDDD